MGVYYYNKRQFYVVLGKMHDDGDDEYDESWSESWFDTLETRVFTEPVTEWDYEQYLSFYTRPRVLYTIILIVLDELKYTQSRTSPQHANANTIKTIIKYLDNIVNEVSSNPTIQRIMNLSSGGGLYTKTKELIKIPNRERRLTVYKKNGRKYVKIGKKYHTISAASRQYILAL